MILRRTAAVVLEGGIGKLCRGIDFIGSRLMKDRPHLLAGRRIDGFECSRARCRFPFGPQNYFRSMA